ncbi:PhnD/SsuA/transferrin family substrate-binding protein [Clostridium sp. Ade.TY]|uniref:phosphate/phosphite/phosphonate ABC transporter substrate-binding protein n=1 Tax=Clostridium sp. Ade.TY TaxID=1391647 RepID=UPI0003FA2EBE
MKMKKIVSLMGALVLGASMLAGCGSSSDTSKLPEELVVQFVPSREPGEILEATKPLSGMLKEKLSEKGYDFNNVKIEVGTSFEVVGEGLTSGTAHVGFIPGSTYVLYDDGAEAILTATRDGLNHDSDNAKDWNKEPTKASDKQAVSYRALIIAGPSEKGQELAKKINNGEKLTTEDLKTAKWGVPASTTSPAGYVYPSLWLKDNYGMNGLGELPNVVPTDSYTSAMARLASGQLDIITTYADARRDNEDRWKSEMGGKDIWKDTAVIGVTPAIYNDTISVSKNADFIDDNFKKALQESFIEIAGTKEGKEIISVYSHNGYEIAEDKNYDKEREAQELIKSMNK